MPDKPSDAPLPTVMDLTPMNPAFNDDPHQFLDRLRSECPVRHDAGAGTFIMTRYADVRGVLSDTTMWRDPSRAEPEAYMAHAVKNQRAPGAPPPVEGDDMGILMLDDPDHARIRQPLARALYKRVAKSRPLVELVVREALDDIGDADEFDLMAKYALRVPIDVIARILGVDQTRLSEFRAWSEGIIQFFNAFRTPEEGERLLWAAESLRGYMNEMMARRRAVPEDDLVTDMMQLQAEGAPLRDGEISVNLQSLLVGGNLTTTDLIGNGVMLFLKNPSELAKLKSDPSLINSAVEEILRFESPIDITARVASRDLELSGCPIKKTQSLFTSLRGANRDPDAFPDPHRFDIARKDAPHVAFGGGAHLCIGAPLARLEAQVALTMLFARYPGLRLADADFKPQWRTLPFFRGLKELPVAAA